VPAKAIMIRLAPFLKPSTGHQARQHQAHEEREGQQHGTPAAEFLVFSIANMKPKAPARNTISRHAAAHRELVMPVDTPTQAPSTVGTIDSASSQ
jgi:hypothetical protein